MNQQKIRGMLKDGEVDEAVAEAVKKGQRIKVRVEVYNGHGEEPAVMELEGVGAALVMLKADETGERLTSPIVYKGGIYNIGHMVSAVLDLVPIPLANFALLLHEVGVIPLPPDLLAQARSASALNSVILGVTAPEMG